MSYLLWFYALIILRFQIMYGLEEKYGLSLNFPFFLISAMQFLNCLNSIYVKIYHKILMLAVRFHVDYNFQSRFHFVHDTE